MVKNQTKTNYTLTWKKKLLVTIRTFCYPKIKLKLRQNNQSSSYRRHKNKLNKNYIWMKKIKQTETLLSHSLIWPTKPSSMKVIRSNRRMKIRRTCLKVIKLLIRRRKQLLRLSQKSSCRKRKNLWWQWQKKRRFNLLFKQKLFQAWIMLTI